ncbi:hypothetical protein ACFZCT_31405 [Streptomyces qaidamensis]|uniref:hypothetical protein n=1 Tax=Streptomyces qaidamensis TaxID=1783515 RepID=UPI0036EF9E80
MHHTTFDVPVQAAIAPDSPGDASSYRARYDEAGRLRPSAASPFEERSAEIRQRADAIIQASVQRSRHGVRAPRHGVPKPARSPGFQLGPSSAGSRL